MTSPSGPRGSGRPSPNGHAADGVQRPSPRPAPVHEPEPPTEQVPVIAPGSPTQAVPVVGPFSGAPADPTWTKAPAHRAFAPQDEAVPVVAKRRDLEPQTEAMSVIRREPEPPTAAVKVVSPDLFTQHLPPAAGRAPATAVAAPEPDKAGKSRRLPIDLGPGALRRTWTASQPPTAMRRAFLAALLVPAVHVVTIVLGLIFVAVAYGSYSVGTVLGGNLVAVAGWVVAALVAVWVGVQARAGRLWAAILLAVLAVVALVFTIGLALGTLTWIGLSGLPGVVRLLLLVLAGALCLAVPLLMIGPLRRGCFRAPIADS